MNKEHNEVESLVSTKDFLKGVFKFFNLLGRNWRLLLIGLLLGATFEQVYRYFSDKSTTYMAKMTFNLELGGESGGGQLSGFASQLGIGPQATGGDLFSKANFPLIMQSLAVHEKAFMKEVTVDGKKMLFINYFIDSSDIKTNEWAPTFFRDKSMFFDYRFKSRKNPEDFTPFENQLILDVYQKILPYSETKPVENSTFIQIVTSTTNEKLTKVWVETLLQAAEEFYREAKTKKSRQLLATQERRLDSLRYLMQSSDRKLSRLTFDNPNVVDPNGAMQQQQVTRNNSYYSQQYITQMATVENLNRAILEQTPIFTVVEPIRLPLFTGIKPGLKEKLGSLVGLLIALVFIVVRNLYKEIMND